MNWEFESMHPNIWNFDKIFINKDNRSDVFD